MNTNSDALVGSWTYRSFFNNPDYISDIRAETVEKFRKELDKFHFGEGHIEVVESPTGTFAGTLHLGEGSDEYRLNLKGTIEDGATLTLHFQGVGIPGTRTEGHVYDYVGYLVPTWPNGDAEQKKVMVGSLIRTVAHDGEPAGLVASFIAVRWS